MFRVIPAIDILDGRAVRLYQGDFNQLEVISEDPMRVAAAFVSAGADLVHIVDLNGAQQGISTNRPIIEAIGKRFPGKVQLGGGLRTAAHVEQMLTLGVGRVVLGTIAVDNPEIFREICNAYPKRVGLSLDVRSGLVHTNGWEHGTTRNYVSLLQQAQEAGAGFVVYTDIAKDGTMLGPNWTELEQVLSSTRLPVVVSGGISSEHEIELLHQVGQSYPNLVAAIVGKGIYKGKVSIAGSTLCRRIIPCLDVDKGRVVKGTKFMDLRSVGDPVELAKCYEDQGADELVILDVSATNEGRGTTIDLIRQVARNLSIPLTVGGGVKSSADARLLLRAGADKVAINTAAYRTPSVITELAQEFGSQCVVAAVDVKRQGDSWRVVVASGREETNEDAIQWMQKLESLGVGEILLTSIDSDGIKRGYDVNLLQAAKSAVSVPIIASGGAGSTQDFAQAFAAGIDACLAASVFHYGVETVASLKHKLEALGVNVR